MRTLGISDEPTVYINGNVICRAEERKNVGFRYVRNVKEFSVYTHGHIVGNIRLHRLELIRAVEIYRFFISVTLPVARDGKLAELYADGVELFGQERNRFVKFKIPFARKHRYRIGAVSFLFCGDGFKFFLIGIRYGICTRSKFILFKNGKIRV